MQLTSVSLLMQFLELQAAPQSKAHRVAAEKSETFIGITPLLLGRRQQFTDLIVAQVKVGAASLTRTFSDCGC